MNIKYLLFLSIALIVLCGFQTNDPYIINLYKGIDQLSFKKNNLEDAQKILGKGKIVKTNLKYHHGRTIIYEYYNEKKGIRLGAYDDKKINSFDFRYPFNGQTSEGIKIGKSSKKDLIDNYGKPNLEAEFTLNKSIIWNRNNKFRGYQHDYWIPNSGKYELVSFHQKGFSFIIQKESKNSALNDKVLCIKINAPFF